MKQSGIDWIGEIPDDWKTRQIRYLFSLRDERNYKPLSEVNLISVYTDKGVLQHRDIEQTTGNKAQNADGYKHVYKNDLVVNIILCWMGALGISDFDGVTSPAYDVYAPKDLSIILPKYYHYLFRTPQFNGKCYTEGRGIMQMRWRTYSSEFKSIKVPLPPKATQQRIAEYLDSKCVQIDSIIEESKKSIEEYKAWKQSVIFEAITGKNLNCKKKDSGIEWIGEIPEGWEVKRLKNLFDFGKGLPITKENLKETGVSVISYGQIHSKQNSGTRIDDSLKRFVDESYLTSNSNSLVHKSDFIFADTSEDLEGCGNCVYVDEEQTLFAGYHTIIFSSKIKQSNKYLAYLFKTDAWRNQIRSRCNGVKLFSITKRILSNVNVILPPLAEQESIAKMLDSKCAQIDSLVAEKESLIADLTEYKKSLIFEVVTGKRSV